MILKISSPRRPPLSIIKTETQLNGKNKTLLVDEKFMRNIIKILVDCLSFFVNLFSVILKKYKTSD